MGVYDTKLILGIKLRKNNRQNVFRSQQALGSSLVNGKKLNNIEKKIFFNLPSSQLGFPGCSVVKKKNLPANTGGVGLISELGRSPRERSGNSLQYSSLGNPKPGGL